MKLLILLASFAFLKEVFMETIEGDDFFNPEIVKVCEIDEVCVRFCCTSEVLCSNPDFFQVEKFPKANNLSVKFKVLKGKPNCQTFFAHEWKFFENGSVGEYFKGDKATYNHDKYCFSKEENKMYVCASEYEVKREPVDITREIYPYLMLFSVPFLFATFLVYACIKELRNLHGKCLICHLLSLIGVYLSFALIQLGSSWMFEIKWLCKTVGYIAYFSLLTCISWLNVMCYDIYSTFRGLKITFQSDRRSFGFYCLYAYGLPVVAIIAVLLINDYASFVPDHFKIQMGVNRCWMYASRRTELYYIYIPISVILTLNIIFFAISAKTIFSVQKETSIIISADRRSSNVNLEKARFSLYLRLFIIMGVSWVIDIISWVLNDSLFAHISGIINLVNCLQGIMIFSLFVMRLKVRKLIAKKFTKSHSHFALRQLNSTHH